MADVQTHKTPSAKEVGAFLAGFAKNKVPLIKQLVSTRKLLRKNQADVSRGMGVTPSAVCILESGKRSGNLETIQRYAESLELRVVLMPKESL
jgi:DNA-binding XRE family transcriptional regulator